MTQLCRICRTRLGDKAALVAFCCLTSSDEELKIGSIRAFKRSPEEPDSSKALWADVEPKRPASTTATTTTAVTIPAANTTDTPAKVPAGHSWNVSRLVESSCNFPANA